MIDPTIAGDIVNPNARVQDLEFCNKTFYRIMSKTVCPKKCTHSKDLIKGIMQNLLISMANEHPFDVEDFFIRDLVDSAALPLVPKPYVPWIQLFLNKHLERPYVADCAHEFQLPPVPPHVPIPSRAKTRVWLELRSKYFCQMFPLINFCFTEDQALELVPIITQVELIL